MVRKIKNFKDATMRRKGYVDLSDELVLPVHTRGSVTLQDVMTDYEKTLQLPKMNLKPAKAENIEELLQLGYKKQNNAIMVREFDYTSPQYLELVKQRNQIEVFAKIAIHIDLEYLLEDETPLWEALGLSSDKDYIGMANFIKGLDLRQPDLSAVSMVIQHIAKSNFKTYEDYEEELDRLTKESLDDDILE